MPNEDKPLDHAIILDTEGDVYTKMLVACSGCGNELEVVSVEDKPEVAVVLSVSVCSTCEKLAHHAGYHKGSSEEVRGF